MGTGVEETRMKKGKKKHGTQSAKCLKLRALGLPCFILAAYLQGPHPGYFTSSCLKPTHIAETLVTYVQI